MEYCHYYCGERFTLHFAGMNCWNLWVRGIWKNNTCPSYHQGSSKAWKCILVWFAKENKKLLFNPSLWMKSNESMYIDPRTLDFSMYCNYIIIDPSTKFHAYFCAYCSIKGCWTLVSRLFTNSSFNSPEDFNKPSSME